MASAIVVTLLMHPQIQDEGGAEFELCSAVPASKALPLVALLSGFLAGLSLTSVAEEVSTFHQMPPSHSSPNLHPDCSHASYVQLVHLRSRLVHEITMALEGAANSANPTATCAATSRAPTGERKWRAGASLLWAMSTITASAIAGIHTVQLDMGPSWFSVLGCAPQRG